MLTPESVLEQCRRAPDTFRRVPVATRAVVRSEREA